MQAYHNNENVKALYVQRMEDHIKADELIRGVGYEKGKGCAVGCTLNNYSHDRYPIELGLPEWLARLEDSLFEGMSLEKSKTFPLEFLKVIKVGVDVEKIKIPFLIIIVKSVLDKFDHNKFPDVLVSINKVLDILDNAISNGLDIEAARAADDAARAARAADDAAGAAWAAAGAAGAAAWAAAGAARAAEDAARAAEDAAWAAWAATWAAAGAALAAAGAAWAAQYDYFADELLKLLKECE